MRVKGLTMNDEQVIALMASVLVATGRHTETDNEDYPQCGELIRCVRTARNILGHVKNREGFAKQQ
jgi:hypothetical protein